MIAGWLDLRCCGCRSLDNVNMQNGRNHDIPPTTLTEDYGEITIFEQFTNLQRSEEVFWCIISQSVISFQPL